ncbi:hypothetical protein PILCRDRAFT_626058 [Piloderma croceum F 1598]|uniref:Uncharacterized protein n=1 Tax=Piloderma croceum (strain F 1598) TaxID=765440 RepID=A0A0C3ATK0_PILCF|nr:hypothetical protein PILCRDRAFT_626058 [Piloderma croceum F 1598]
MRTLERLRIHGPPPSSPTTASFSKINCPYNQNRLYRSYPLDAVLNNLRSHVLLVPRVENSAHWSTGNAWGATRILRVLGTIRSSQYNSSMIGE